MPCYSFIHRHLLFGEALCGNINPTYLTTLQRVQNKAVRIITNSELRASINPCLFKSVITNGSLQANPVNDQRKANAVTPKSTFCLP